MGAAVIEDLGIDGARLDASLRALGEVGAYDAGDGLRGVNRLALTDADAEGRRLVMRWFEDAGLQLSVDAIGNVYGRRAGHDETLPPVLCGSHVDSVPTAGRFDGCLGVLGGLEVVRTLNDAGRVTRRPIVVAFFTDEEGCRFGTDMLGSAVATGRLPLEHALALRDRDGVTVGDELRRLGFDGRVPVDAMRPHGYLECHIEQGPVLAREGAELGVVSGVQAILWHRVEILGRAAHAGTTPIEYRRDAGLAAARLNVHLREMVDSGRHGEGMRATVGAVEVAPGAVNVVPSAVVTSVDLRHPDDARMAAAEAEVVTFYRELEQREGVRIRHERTARTPAVAFDDRVRALIASVADGLGIRHRPILSGAGHDAQEWARLCPTGMIFVPGEHDGISHNPRESSTPAQCEAGVSTLLHALVALADED